MNRFLNRISIVLMSALLLLTGFIPAQAEGEDFDEFLKQEWKEMMDDYVTMHYSVKDYQAEGLTKPDVNLGEVSYEEYARIVEERKASLDHLHQFDYESLDERQKIDYLVYEENLNNDIAVFSYPNFKEMFNPYSGAHSDLTTTFTEFTFYTKDDIDDYLILADDYDRYVDEMIEFTRKQAEQGYFMRDVALDVQLGQMKEFIDKGEENPFIVIFNNNVDAFEGLTEEERTAYKERNRDLVLNQIIPSNQKAMEFLETLRGSRSVSGSIYEYPDGKEYFEKYVRLKTSDEGDIRQKFDYLSEAVKDSFEYLMDTALSFDGDPQEQMTQFKDPEDILAYLSEHLEGFPKGPDINYVASYLDPSVANPSVMAYYLATPIDDVTNNVIRVNGTSVGGDDMTTMYYTLAHEGFPGHMYQFTWYYSQDYNPIRHDLSAIGYTEGWAQYVEKIMLNRSPLNPSAQEYQAVNVFVSYALQAAIDLAVNGLGYGEKELGDWLKGLGLGEGMDTKELYDAVVDMPGMILPYGYGIAKFWELRERTESALGEDFDLEDYHLQILTNGPRNFNIVETDLKKYVESKGKVWPSQYTLFEHERPEGMVGIGGIVNFIYQHRTAFLIGAIVVVLLVLLLLFFLIRGILRLIFGKKKKKTTETAEHPNE